MPLNLVLRKYCFIYSKIKSMEIYMHNLNNITKTTLHMFLFPLPIYVFFTIHPHITRRTSRSLKQYALSNVLVFVFMIHLHIVFASRYHTSPPKGNLPRSSRRGLPKSSRSRRREVSKTAYQEVAGAACRDVARGCC